MAKRLKDLGFKEEDEDELPDDEEGSKPAKKERSPLRDVAAPEFEVSKLHNGVLEFATLVRVVMDEDLQARLWPRLTEDHFAADTTRSIYRRLKTLNQLGRAWPKLATLAMDPAIDKAAQAQINTVVARSQTGRPLFSKVKITESLEVPLETLQDYEGHVFDLLEAYRVTRKGIEHFVDTVGLVADDEEFDPFSGPELVERAATEVMAIRGQESISEVLMHFGHGTMSEDADKRRSELRKLFSSEKRRFKTGIEAFDKKAGGFQGGEVVLLGANTGGGKTAAMLTMMTNMGRMGTSTAMLQLELSLQQMDERLASHLARINSEVIRNGNLTQAQQEQITQAWDEFDDDLKTAKSRFTVFTPSSQTIAGCEMVFKQYKYQVWFIDYVKLINLDGDKAKLDGWQKLSEVTKEFKALAKKYNITIVIGVQVNIDNDGNIEVRYAKAMQEDADIALVWHLSQEAKDEGVVWWRHLKARQYEPFDFPVKIALEFYAFENFRDEPSKRKQKTLGRKKVHEKDEVDQALESGNFKRKDKPLVVDDERPIMDAALSSDLAVQEQGTPKLELDDEDDYLDFDEG